MIALTMKPAEAEDVVWVASTPAHERFVVRASIEEVPARDESIDEPPHGRTTEPASQEPGDE